MCLVEKIESVTHIVVYSRSSGNAFFCGAGRLRFKSRAGYIGHNVAGHNVASGLPPLLSSKGAGSLQAQ